MAETLTPQQEQAVYDRGGKLLVSAAAGSGKTKVLVDRLMQYVLDPKDPANLDDFLIITYTKAAASELRGKIAAKLTEHLAAQPENRHLQRQMQRLYLAKISTVHSFCGDILREYAYKLDIAPDFRVAEENECVQMREFCMSQLLDAAYENVEKDDDFRAFVDSQGLGRDDRTVPEILLKIHESAQCHIDPDAWLDRCVHSAQIEGLTDASETIWGEYLMTDLKKHIAMEISALEECARAASAAEGMVKATALLYDTIDQLRRLSEYTTWDAIVAGKNIAYGSLNFEKTVTDIDLRERIKAVRDACKKSMGKRLASFADCSEQIFADMATSAAAARGMVALVRRFDELYRKAKRSRRVLDYSDLEHKTLELLLGSSRSGPTVAAREIGERFREVMVDEYQDSNAVQDAIFSALTDKRNNCFMVGDVKQSIYQFRLADPTIFLKKYDEYLPAEKAQPGDGRKVNLSCNFRSGAAVLEGANDVFRYCMTKDSCGLDYGDDEALREGGTPHTPLGEPEVELLAVTSDIGDYEADAKVVANRIVELLDGKHMIREKNELRPIRPEDIAILLRAPGSTGGYYRKALAECGIRCISGGGDDLLQTGEVGSLRALLQTISNPRQDIPLTATLASPMFGFTADDLAQLRGNHPFGDIYDALLASDMPKAKAFLETLEDLRREARLETLASLIQKIFNITHIDSVYAAMEDGQLKCSNLQTFYTLAVAFESGGRRDLEQFLEHLTALEGKGLVASGDQSAAGSVTMMSIHKSKGLEFPVVFLPALSKQFNRESFKATVYCDPDLYFGLVAIDEEKRLRYPTIAKKAIAVKMEADSLAEELRVLYVAMTRAKDRLIMSYSYKNLAKDLTEMALRMDIGDPNLMIKNVICAGEWILMTALRRTEAGALFACGDRPIHTYASKIPWLIRVVEDTAAAALDAAPELTTENRIPEEELAAIEKGLAFRYAHTAATIAPSKQTATQRKGRDKDAEVAEDTQEPAVIHRKWRKAAFGKAKATATDKGNATHAVMQYIRYAACHSTDSIRDEVERLVNQRFITREQADLVDIDAIAAFFATPIGQKLQKSHDVLREFKFSILDDGENFDPALRGEKILLQGVVDCALLEEDGITVVDFKTDKVTDETLPDRVEHYKPQILAYADALSRIYQKSIKESQLYFFHIGKAVLVTE